MYVKLLFVSSAKCSKTNFLYLIYNSFALQKVTEAFIHSFIRTNEIEKYAIDFLNLC